MARFVHWTDLHTEFAPFDSPPPPPEGVDAILIGGDTGVGVASADVLERVWDAYRVPVLCVVGNHEYYGQEVGRFEHAFAARVAGLQAKGKDVRWLQGDAVVVAGVRVIGATLWTDMELLGETGWVHALRGMNDYRRIAVAEDRPLDPDAIAPRPPLRALQVADTVAWHRRDWAKVEAHLATPHDGPTVVLTHHLPSPLCIAPRYRGDGLNAAFASDKTTAIMDSQVDWWFYGHSHGPVEFDLPRADGGVCRMRSNCRGYPQEWAHTGFDPRLVHTVA